MDKIVPIMQSVIYTVREFANSMMTFLTVPFINTPLVIFPESIAKNDAFVLIWGTIMENLGFMNSATGWESDVTTIEVFLGSGILIIIGLQIVKFIKGVIL